MQKEKLRNLLQRYASGDCTPDEQKYLEDMILRNPMNNDWDWSNDEEMQQMGARIKQAVDRRIKTTKPVMKFRYWYLGIAASVTLVVASYLFNSLQNNITTPAHVLITDQPIGNLDGVRLKLDDDSVVDLDGSGTALNGLNVKLTKGQLVYANQSGDEKPRSGRYHTLIVPNGKQFQVSLSDGTKVWINAASKLTFPINFSTKERRVELTGEAYFEVAHNKNIPFKVVANGTETIVTGTHFNVSAYNSDKNVRVTLIEGGVKVKQSGAHVALRPGYEAIAYTAVPAMVTHKGNIEQVMAWKNGYFIFDNMDILSIMNSVSRWYGISVYAKGPISSQKIGGTFPVTAELDELLNDLSKLANIKLKRNGKEVVIE